MTEKKLFMEPILIKHEERLDEVSRWNGFGSHPDSKPTKNTKSRRHHRRDKD